jgi:pilus assembly protein CpaE
VRRVLTNTPVTSGQVFAFVGAKGGVGTTTLAVNTAAALGRSARSDALMMDLHMGHGDGAVFLGVEPRFSVADALDNIQRVDQSYFAGIIEKTRVGIHLLASSARPLRTPLDGKRVRTLLDTAAQAYRTTVLDVSRADATILDALDAAAAIVVVTSQELASLRNAIPMTESLRHRYGAGRVKVVINRFQQESAVAAADIERALGGAVHHKIPSDYRAAVEAQNAGRPIVLEDDGRLAKALKTFAKDLAGLGKERAERSTGVLARLAWRRA